MLFEKHNAQKASIDESLAWSVHVEGLSITSLVPQPLSNPKLKISVAGMMVAWNGSEGLPAAFSLPSAAALLALSAVSDAVPLASSAACESFSDPCDAFSSALPFNSCPFLDAWSAVSLPASAAF